MKITDVNVLKVNSDNKASRMRGIASITIDDCFVVHDLKILEKEGELFIVMPSEVTREGNFKDIAHPINSETRAMIQNAVIEEYNKD